MYIQQAYRQKIMAFVSAVIGSMSTNKQGGKKTKKVYVFYLPVLHSPNDANEYDSNNITILSDTLLL